MSSIAVSPQELATRVGIEFDYSTPFTPELAADLLRGATDGEIAVLSVECLATMNFELFSICGREAERRYPNADSSTDELLMATYMNGSYEVGYGVVNVPGHVGLDAAVAELDALSEPVVVGPTEAEIDAEIERLMAQFEYDVFDLNYDGGYDSDPFDDLF